MVKDLNTENHGPLSEAGEVIRAIIEVVQIGKKTGSSVIDGPGLFGLMKFFRSWVFFESRKKNLLRRNLKNLQSIG